MNELEELLEQADDIKISLSIINNPDGSMSSGRYNPKSREITINPCQSDKELAITFVHELYHDYASVSNRFGSRALEEYHAEKYAQEIYEDYSKEIINYLQDRRLL